MQAHEQLAPDIFRLTVHSPQIAQASAPGQFVMIKSSNTSDPLLRRPFSIHDVTSGGMLHLLYKVIGKGTRCLQNLSPGEQTDLIGPLGHGFQFSVQEPACLLGGGMGIAPLLYLAKSLQNVSSPRQDHQILLGARTSVELAPLVDDFQQLGYTVQAATDDGSLGHHGFVSELLEEVLPSVRTVYVCGPHPLMAAIARQCQAADVPCQVSLETHMACGLGACLGCTIYAPDKSYRHVCKHGPVFDANEVLWTL
ncbi:dihydroorotate dehydrogenase electron transfer subunit [Desulfogranum japonicum]|uniref:dihydroorotate dehydrogenase electron transfer subunit n=1 Tax=Desulfogranum japonicum TaxID=231447 RepID=UPI0003FA10A4|nr:dihydroorotate dehydrogenase electron transfer subunit [Desulfogranum japonicum]